MNKCLTTLHAWGGAPPLRTSKWLYGSMIFFVGAGGAGDFVLGIRQWEFFFTLYMYTQNTQNFVENSNG